MAVSKGLLVLMLLAATACIASAGDESCVCTGLWTDECQDECFSRESAAKQAAASSVSVASDTEVTTSALPARGATLYVNPSGKGGAYKTIQAAINAVPDGNKKRIIINIAEGTYRQKLRITSKKSYIYFKCASRKTLITWGDTAEKAGSTSLSASTAVEAMGFIASDCTFANSAPAPPGGAVGKQAVALRIQGDQGAFYRCGFLGAQDTLYDKEGRHFFRSCEIVGSIDWIFGDGQSFYQYCKLTSIAKGTSGSVTAQKRDGNTKTGFVFFQCSIGGTGQIWLGRAWGTHSRVIFYQCNIANVIRPEGWMDWDVPARQKTTYYAEYACTGPGANRSGRVKWSKVLTAAQAKPFSSVAFVDGKSWLEPAM
jgi:pectinesterase